MQQVVESTPGPDRADARRAQRAHARVGRQAVTFSVAIYVLAFLVFAHPTDLNVVPLVAAPVLTTGWFFGTRAGLVAGLLALPVNTLLYNVVGLSGWDAVLRNVGGLLYAFLPILGWGFGRVRELSVQSRSESAHRREAELAWHHTEEFFQATLDTLRQHVTVLDPAGRVITVNTAWRQFSPLNRLCLGPDAGGTNFFEICNALARAGLTEAQSLAQGLRAVMDEREQSFWFEYSSHSPQGIFWYSARVTRLKGYGPLGFVVVHEDITSWKEAQDGCNRLQDELVAAERRLEHAAFVDPLTGLPNRRHATDRLKREWADSQRSGRPVACCRVDIDHFKQLNDASGNKVGDLVLRETANVLRDSVRVCDELCRIGGDAFLVICPDTDLYAAEECAERLRAMVEVNTVEARDATHHVTTSIGVAAFHEGYTSPDELLKACDKSVDAARQAGGNRVHLAKRESSPAKHPVFG